MQKTITINLEIAEKFDLSITECAVCDWFLQNIYCIHPLQIAKDLPIISDKADTFYRICRKLLAKKVVRLVKMDDHTAIRFMDKGFSKGCIFCGRLYGIHKHHYPIRKKDGGTETVLLCANHHHEFHRAVDFGVFFLEKL